MQAEWEWPQKRGSPMSLAYSPQLEDKSATFVNEILGYPICPIIGRYNRGEYKMSEVLIHVEFKCRFDHQRGGYYCGEKKIGLPQLVQFNLRNIAEVIMVNGLNYKQAPPAVPEEYPVRDELNLIWVISIGQLGMDFLNYLNHMYILADRLFLDQKMARQVHYLPIYAYRPDRSGLHPVEVDKGLNFENYRGQYMSFHLVKGSPAFSPNNMRLAVEGGKIIQNQQQPKPKKQKGEKGQKGAKQQHIVEKEQEQNDKPAKQEEQVIVNFEELEQQAVQNVPKIEGEPGDRKEQSQKVEVQEKKEKKDEGSRKPRQPKANWKEYRDKNQAGPPPGHQGFVHFYTSVLLEKDYRVYYHWHLEHPQKVNIIRQLLRSTASIDQFYQHYVAFGGEDPMADELRKLLFS